MREATEGAETGVRVALYARVSTKQHGQNPETQLLPLRDYASIRTLTVVNEFVDLGFSGAKDRRPQLDRLMNAARAKEFDAVIVWRFDRFARSTKHLLTALSEFQSLSINFISLQENIDTSTPMGKMLFTIMGALGEFERNLIRERVQAGVDRAKREGKKLGRPRALVDEQRIAELLEEGHSVRSLARTFAIAQGTVRSIRDRYRNKAECEPAQNPV